MKTDTPKQGTPHFGGKLTDFKDKQERAFEKKHLWAFIRGMTEFRHGFHSDAHGVRHPTYYKVKVVMKQPQIFYPPQ